MIEELLQLAEETIWMLWLIFQISFTIIGAIIGKKLSDYFLKNQPGEFTWLLIILFAYIAYKASVAIATTLAISTATLLILSFFTPIGAILAALLTNILKAGGTRMENKIIGD